jgi:hypothetical protein
MKVFVSFFLGSFFATASWGSDIDPFDVEFPWMNGPTRDAMYILADNPNRIHIFEAYSLSCGWCNRNAPQVAAMAEEFADDSRVQFIDLGLDTNQRDYDRWIAAHQPNYPVVKDVGREVWNALAQENGIPQTFVVDCQGNLVDFTIGYWGNSEKNTLREAIAEALLVECD